MNFVELDFVTAIFVVPIDHLRLWLFCCSTDVFLCINIFVVLLRERFCIYQRSRETSCSSV